MIKSWKKIIVCAIYLPIFILKILVFDYAIHTFVLTESKSYLHEPFFLGAYYDDFLVDYLHLKDANYASKNLNLDECTHILSIEDAKIDFKNWHFQDETWYNRNDYWFVRNSPTNKCRKIFNVFHESFIGINQELEVSISNYTKHSYQFCVEQQVDNKWIRKQISIAEKDSIINNEPDTMNLYYWINWQPEQHEISFKGTNRIYQLSLEGLSIGTYRIATHLEEHEVIYTHFNIVKERPFEWEISKEDFYNPDTVIVEIKNTSDETLYHVSWYREQPVIFYDLTVYRNGQIEKIDSDGYGCGTGLMLLPIYESEKINVVSYNPMIQYGLIKNIADKEVIQHLKERYGDSVMVQCKLNTYGVGFGDYQSQTIFAPPITLNTNELLQKWIEYDKHK